MLSSLRSEFSCVGISFEADAAGLVYVNVENSVARARVMLQGAQVLSYAPNGEQGLLWLSDDAVFVPGKPVRGGIPLCWPWFGPGAREGQAAHGFARNLEWQLLSVSGTDDCSELVFGLKSTAETLVLWPHDFALRYRVVVGERLQVALETENTGATPFEFTEALHSYLPVQDVAQTSVTGLDGCRYIDKLQEDGVHVEQVGDIVVASELDRIYQDDRASCELVDAAGGRRLRLSKSGSASTVVWNPWVEKAASMADFANGGYRTMLCIETANTGQQRVRLAPGERHEITQTVERV